jgi:hypothetical protein
LGENVFHGTRLLVAEDQFFQMMVRADSFTVPEAAPIISTVLLLMVLTLWIVPCD